MACYYQLRVKHSGGVQRGVATNTYGIFSGGSIPTQAEADAAALALYNLISSSNYKDLFPTTISIEVDSVVTGGVVGSPPTATFSVHPGDAVLGTVAGAQAAPQLALCVSFKSNTFGRHGRGRVYLGPLSAARVTSGGILNPGSAGALDTVYTAYFNALNTATLLPAIINRSTHTAIAITNARIGDRIDSQRRRKPRTEIYSA